jgi:hypothetical protein
MYIRDSTYGVLTSKNLAKLPVSAIKASKDCESKDLISHPIHVCKTMVNETMMSLDCITCG